MSLVNVTIIYGTMTKGNTYNCVQLLLNNLRLTMNIKVTEFFLSDNNFQIDYVDCIVKSLNNSDLIILASPVYSCDINTQMKVLLDNLSNKVIAHKINSIMHNKIGLVISTSAGAGLFNATRSLKRYLYSLGVNNTFRLTETLYEMNWDNLTLKRKIQINKQISKLSCKILHLHINSSNVIFPILSKIISSKIQPIVINNKSNMIDLSYRKNNSHYHNKKNIH
jgi:flavorubredoxin